MKSIVDKNQETFAASFYFFIDEVSKCINDFYQSHAWSFYSTSHALLLILENLNDKQSNKIKIVHNSTSYACHHQRNADQFHECNHLKKCSLSLKDYVLNFDVDWHS